MHLSISNGFVSSKICDKRDDFDFDIVNFPFLNGDVPRSTSYGVYFPFGFEGRIWDLIVSFPDHCLSFYFTFLNLFGLVECVVISLISMPVIIV